MALESPFALHLLTVLALGFVMISVIPRVDGMPDGLRKFFALTTLGISYLVVLTLVVYLGDNLGAVEPVNQVLWIAVVGYLLFGITLLYDIADDWLRLFVDPEFNTLVEASMVIALFVLLVVFFVLVP